MRAWILEHLPPAWRIGLQAAKEVDTSNDQAQAQEQGKVELLEPSEPIKRLREILEQEPVVLDKRELRKFRFTGQDPAWLKQNMQLVLELQRLLFLDPDVGAFCWNHSDQVITAENFWKGLRVE